jgi:hypothetical protein
VSVAPPAADEFDRSGVPFDVRIHQKSRNQKKDGTWKLQKGIDDSVVAAVMQELAPRMLKAPAVAPPAPSATPAPVGASAPVPLPPPPIPSPPGASIAPPVPPYPGTPQENLSPPSTAIPQAPGDQGKALDPFRTLVAKITAARAEKPPRITAEEVNSIVASAGAPSLQLLNNMPHLLPVVDANIDALLATR